MQQQLPQVYVTKNTKLATVLATVGFAFADPNAPCANLFQRGKQKPNSPGDVRYGFLTETSDGLQMEKAEVAFDSEGADQAFDFKLDALKAAAAGTSLATLVDELVESHPAALIAFGKRILINRDVMANAWRSVKPLVFEKRGTGAVIYSENLSATDRQKLRI